MTTPAVGKEDRRHLRRGRGGGTTCSLGDRKRGKKILRNTIGGIASGFVMTRREKKKRRRGRNKVSSGGKPIGVTGKNIYLSKKNSTFNGKKDGKGKKEKRGRRICFQGRCGWTGKQQMVAAGRISAKRERCRGGKRVSFLGKKKLGGKNHIADGKELISTPLPKKGALGSCQLLFPGSPKGSAERRRKKSRRQEKRRSSLRNSGGGKRKRIQGAGVEARVGAECSKRKSWRKTDDRKRGKELGLEKEGKFQKPRCAGKALRSPKGMQNEGGKKEFGTDWPWAEGNLEKTWEFIKKTRVHKKCALEGRVSDQRVAIHLGERKKEVELPPRKTNSEAHPRNVRAKKRRRKKALSPGGTGLEQQKEDLLKSPSRARWKKNSPK